jgi:hypothetical protein
MWRTGYLVAMGKDSGAKQRCQDFKTPSVPAFWEYAAVQKGLVASADHLAGLILSLWC